MKKLISLLLALVLCMSLCAAAFADVYTDAGFIKKIPMKPKYTEAVENHGTVEILNYTCHSYALEAMASGDFAVSEAADGNTQLPEIPDGLLPAAGEDIKPHIKCPSLGILPVIQAPTKSCFGGLCEGCGKQSSFFFLIYLF